MVVGHVLYKTGDKGAPDQIKDRNGEVVLAMCKICGKAEIELDQPCQPNGDQIDKSPGTPDTGPLTDKDREAFDMLRIALNRRAEVENMLIQMANGTRPLPTKEDCQKMAIKLGTPLEHPDDKAIDAFASAMKSKMKYARDTHGRGGWEDPNEVTGEELSKMLRHHVEKGDPIDVANFCMMLQQRGDKIS